MNIPGNVKKLAVILLGNFLYALAVAFFILPAGLITGGTTGIALFVQHCTGWAVSAFVSVFNIAMFVLGAAVLGRQFALTTLVSTFVYPLFLRLAETVAAHTGPLSRDPMLCTVFAGLLIGVGIALVIQQGASTGGMDIPPLVINKYTGISVAASMYAFDVLILMAQMVISRREQVLYGILLVCIYSVVLEEFLLMGKSQVQVKVVSLRHEAINRALQERLDRGTTLIAAQGGYSRQGVQLVLSVVSRRELFRVTELIRQIDPEAFLIIEQVKEVHGRGFTAKKKYGADGENGWNSCVSDGDLL